MFRLQTTNLLINVRPSIENKPSSPKASPSYEPQTVGRTSWPRVCVTVVPVVVVVATVGEATVEVVVLTCEVVNTPVTLVNVPCVNI